ncbi:hypothetical protein IYC_01299 [Clostridium sporogenes PA 3679]|nr:hypothetical protein IYC_01299 [Clostridium sporogenes PA 3679]
MINFSVYLFISERVEGEVMDEGVICKSYFNRSRYNDFNKGLFKSFWITY